nr:WAS/WASL-interacting protein family member 1-like [Aegilops tauschii subsp. strangulata]
MTTTGATIAGPAKAVQDFHPLIALHHTSREWQHRPSSLTPPPPQHLVDVVAKPRVDDRPHGWQGENTATPPTPILDKEPQPPHSSGRVQDRPRRPSPTPRDGLATAQIRLTTNSCVGTTRSAPPFAALHRGDRQLAARQNSILAKPSQRRHLPDHELTPPPLDITGSTIAAPPHCCLSPPDLPLHHASSRAPVNALTSGQIGSGPARSSPRREAPHWPPAPTTAARRGRPVGSAAPLRRLPARLAESRRAGHRARRQVEEKEKPPAAPCTRNG